MNNKKTIILTTLGLLILIAGSAYFLFCYRDNVIKKGEETKKQVQGIVIEDKNISDKTKPFDIQITYPSITGLDEFNKSIEDTINTTISEFKKLSLENDNAVKEIDPESYAEFPREYSLYISYSKGLVDENTVSIILNISDFTGGAHGSSYFSAFNYDVKNKKEIKLADLFIGQSDYVQKISDFCIADLKKQIKERTEGNDEGWIQDGAGPAETNFLVFKINKDDITFYFPQYQVAAYAVGDFTVTMPK